jgi:hypothetical protein
MKDHWNRAESVRVEKTSSLRNEGIREEEEEDGTPVSYRSSNS